MTYSKSVDEWERTINLTQEANTVTGGNDGEELKITVHTLPTPSDEPVSRFVVIQTATWALDYDEIDAFAAYLKGLIKN